MTRREHQIIAMGEEGKDAAAIAAELGLRERYVDDVLKRLLNPSGNNHAFDEMQRRGSAALLAALIQHHPEITGAAR